METIAHSYLTKLRIISKIPENGQLDLTNNDINIYVPGFVSWVNRKLNGDGKINTVVFLRSFYHELISFTNEIMESIDMKLNRSTRHSRYALLETLVKKIKESQSGFMRLKHTYQSYPKIISMLESIEQDLIENQLTIISAFLASTIHKKLTRLHKASQERFAGMDESDPISIAQMDLRLSPDSSPDLAGKFARQPPNTPNETI